VSVVVPHYSDLDNLAACLAALERQTLPRGGFEIIVADNGSPQGEAAIGRVIDGRARLVIVGERGAGPARNGGAAAAGGAILAFTDSDCRPEPAWLEGGLRALDAFDIVGGRMTVLIQDPERLTPTEAFERVFAFRNEDYVERKGFTVTANLFCRRTVFDAVGGFRTRVAEDVDWCHRARELGFRLGYGVSSGVGHPARRTWPELLRKWRRINQEGFLLAAGRRGGRARWLLKTAALPPSAVVDTGRVLVSRDLTRLSQRLGAIRILWRLRAWRTIDSLRLLFGR
jgi:GT2 family glycosyltransferase